MKSLLMLPFMAAAVTHLPVQPGGEPAPVQDYRSLYEALWRAVDERYYDPAFRGTDWSRVRERFRARSESVRSDDDFEALASDLLATIPSSHLSIRRPSQAGERAGIGVVLTRTEGRDIVSEVPRFSDAWRKGLRPGDGLLTERADLIGPLGSFARVSVETCSGARRVMDVRREQVFWPPERPGFAWRQLRARGDRSIGYMRIDRFDDGAAEWADRAMADLGRVKAIIVDLRQNSGGNVSALRLASYFARGAGPAYLLIGRPYLERLGRAPRANDLQTLPRIQGVYTTEAVFRAMTEHGAVAFWTEEVADRYRGRVILLIGERTGSAAEAFAWYMKSYTSALLVGRPTAATLLSSETVGIGYGWSLTLPVHGIWGPDGLDYADRSVAPQMSVSWTRNDYCEGRDPDLDRAMSLAEAST